jgi:hypothetical protein
MAVKVEYLFRKIQLILILKLVVFVETHTFMSEKHSNAQP